MLKKLLCWAGIILVVLYIGLFALVLSVEGHEPELNGIRHQTQSSGYLIGQTPCGGYVVWEHDDDLDNVVDRCTIAFLAHGKFHLAPAKLTIAPDYTGKLKPTCSCEPVITKSGGGS